MPKRHYFESNGKSIDHVSEMDFSEHKRLAYARPAWGSIGVLVVLSLVIVIGLWQSTRKPKPSLGRSNQEASSQANRLQQSFSQAMRAAELTQTAEFREDWIQVALLWQHAIDDLKSIQISSADYALAQQKIQEYERNLQYAQVNVQTREAQQQNLQPFWTLGSDRELVMAVQGHPSQITQYPTSCHELLHYGNSVIELKNGYVSDYDNNDRNLQVLADQPLALSIQSDQDTWTLGSTEGDVVRLQGTPSRTRVYTPDVLWTLEYDNSSIRFRNGYVISYVNTDQNLKVSTIPVPTVQANADLGTWFLGSSRLNVLTAQNQAPEAIIRDDGRCEETFIYGRSEISFRRGLVVGYRNIGQNLNLP